MVKLREDKKPEEATTSKFVIREFKNIIDFLILMKIVEIYNSQATVGNIEFKDDEDY